MDNSGKIEYCMPIIGAHLMILHHAGAQLSDPARPGTTTVDGRGRMLKVPSCQPKCVLDHLP
jgi:hypothetical protein